MDVQSRLTTFPEHECGMAQFATARSSIGTPEVVRHDVTYFVHVDWVSAHQTESLFLY